MYSLFGFHKHNLGSSMCFNLVDYNPNVDLFSSSMFTFSLCINPCPRSTCLEINILANLSGLAWTRPFKTLLTTITFIPPPHVQRVMITVHNLRSSSSYKKNGQLLAFPIVSHYSVLVLPFLLNFPCTSWPKDASSFHLRLETSVWIFWQLLHVWRYYSHARINF